MKHVHIDKAIGGTNDGHVTPYLPNYPMLSMVKKRDFEPADFFHDLAAPSSRINYEVEHYRLERFHADDCVISFWVERSLSPAAALCQMLLRYVPREDLAEV